MRKAIPSEERLGVPHPENIPSKIETLYMLHHIEDFPIPRSGARMDDFRIKQREKFLNESKRFNEKKK